MPEMLTAASTGTAAFAARGGSTSSKNGTGSPHSACRGPTGQSPWPTTSAPPSTASNATPAHRRGLRRRFSAETQMSARHHSCATDQAACSTRHARARRLSVAQLTSLRVAGAGRISSMDGGRRHARALASSLHAGLDSKLHSALHEAISTNAPPPTPRAITCGCNCRPSPHRLDQMEDPEPAYRPARMEGGRRRL